jgi:hypothetical protein
VRAKPKPPPDEPLEIDDDVDFSFDGDLPMLSDEPDDAESVDQLD